MCIHLRGRAAETSGDGFYHRKWHSYWLVQPCIFILFAMLTLPALAVYDRGLLQTCDQLSLPSTDVQDFTRLVQMRTFNSAPQRHCVEVQILDDDTVESNETFTLSLTTNDPAVLPGGFTTVTIIDNDGMPCSFHDGLYVLQEHHCTCLWDYAPMYLHQRNVSR